MLAVHFSLNQTENRSRILASQIFWFFYMRHHTVEYLIFMMTWIDWVFHFVMEDHVFDDSTRALGWMATSQDPQHLVYCCCQSCDTCTTIIKCCRVTLPVQGFLTKGLFYHYVVFNNQEWLQNASQFMHAEQDCILW